MNFSVELYGITDFMSTNFPRESVLDPVVGFFDLAAFHDLLFEDTISITNSVSTNRVVPKEISSRRFRWLAW